MAKHREEDPDKLMFTALEIWKQWEREYCKQIPVGRIEFRPANRHALVEF